MRLLPGICSERKRYRNMSDAREKDSTFARLIVYAVPFLVSYTLQAFYGIADLFFMGLYEPVSSSAAVAAGTQILHLITTIAVSLAIGCADAIGKAWENGDRESAESTIGATVAFYGLVSVLAAVILNLLTPSIVDLLSLPKAAQESTKRYLHVTFLATPFIALTNLSNSTFRGLGDSRTPMYVLVFTTVVNIILDYVFIGRLSMGVDGAALATLISQALNSVAVVFFLHFLLKRKKMFVSLKRFRLSRKYLQPVTSAGYPIALQESFIQVSFILITVIINRRGLIDAAAAGIGEKLLSFFLLFSSSVSSAVTVRAKEALMEKKTQEARDYLYAGLLVAGLAAILVNVFFQLVPTYIISAFTKDAAVIRNGAKYVRGYSLALIFASVYYVYTGYFNAIGLSGITYMHNMISGVFVRIPAVYFVSILFPRDLYPVGLASASGSVFSMIICLIVYTYISYSKKKNGGGVFSEE